jgi:hypothetical protein
MCVSSSVERRVNVRMKGVPAPPMDIRIKIGGGKSRDELRWMGGARNTDGAK